MKKIIVSIGYLVIIFAIIFLYLDYQAGKPVSDEAGIVNFSIRKGEGLKIIAKNLEKENLIKDKTSFIFYVFLRNLRKNFLPGEYQLRKNSSIKEILAILTTPSPTEKKITLIEGWTNKQIAEYLEKLGFFDKEEFLIRAGDISLFQDKFDFLKEEGIKTLEGFIFPDTYQVPIKATPESIIFRALNNFESKIDDDLKSEIRNQNKTLYQIITLASIVEKEVATKEDREIIAGIFWKRLAAGIALQADSTVNYVTGKNIRRASSEDIKINSPYNTYKYRGLPPGPICNPGLEAIKAAIYPQKSPYWYFLNTEDGKTIYSKTFEEHQQNKIRYLNNKNSFKKGELLVKYKNDDNIYKLYFSPDENIEEIRKEYLQKDKNIEIIEPNYFYHAAFMPNDPGYKEQWFLERLGAPLAWDIVGGGSDEIIVALLDSGVDINHPDLKENIWINKKEIPADGLDNDANGYIDDINGWDFVNNVNNPRPKFYPSYTVSGMNHGTVVAGLIGARSNNNQGVIGLAWNVKIMPIRVLNNRGEGSLEAVIKGVDYAIKNKADIINFSFVGPNPSDLLFQMIKKAWDSNILIVAAAGNNIEKGGDDLDNNFLYPICLDANYKENIILGVTATDHLDRKSNFANYGSKCVDVAAPGFKIYSTLFYYPKSKKFKDCYGGYWSGTSMAAPLVSATAALVKSLNPLISNREIRNILLETANSIDYLAVNEKYKGKLGVGVINTAQAVKETYKKMVAVPRSQYIVAAPRKGQMPLVKIFRPTSVKYSEFFAFDSRFRGGVNITTGDLDDDGVKEIIVAAGQGGGPHVRIFNNHGGLRDQFFAYEEKLRNGIKITTGDINGDGKDEIIVGPETGSLPIRVFNRGGSLLTEFYAFNKNFKGGVSLTTGDINGDGKDEIIVAAGQGGGPQVRIFDGDGNVLSQFFAFNEKFRGGINVAASDLNRDGLSEIVVAIASSGSPYVRVFDSSLYLLSQFLAYERNFYGGVSLTIGDLNGDWQDEIIVAPYKGGGPQVRVFDLIGSVIEQFYAYDKSFGKGLNLTTIPKFD